jgi:hypothetical protein
MLTGDSNERFEQRTGVGRNPSNRVPLVTAPARSLTALGLRQKRVVIVGATGMVGGHALRYALGPSRRRECDRYWAQEARCLARQVERGPSSRLRELLRTR